MPRCRAAAITAAILVLIAPAAARAANYEVFIGINKTPGQPKQASANAFFPHTVTIHPGDVVTWQFQNFHTVTFPVKGEAPPPLIVLDNALPVSGVNDAAGNPFFFNGLPSPILNPVAVARSSTKTWNGSKVLNSGLPLSAKPKPFSLRFRRTGTFTYVCLVHPGMKGTVRVARASRRVASPAAVTAQRLRQTRAYVADAKRVEAKGPPSGAAPTVQVGRTTPALAIYKMFPSTLTINAGQAVTFTMAGEFRSEAHTVTFGPAKLRSGLERNFILPLIGAPAGTFGVIPQGAYPSDPPPLPAYDGTNHGDGFINTGVLDNDPSTPFPNSVQITFTKPGTYDYECVIHAHMDGRIVVR